jgi:integrase
MIYTRPDSKYYWMKFEWEGKPIQKSTRCTNEKDAVRVESSYKAKLARAAAGLERDPTKTTTLEEFREKFQKQIASDRADHPETIDYYQRRYTELLAFAGFDCPLNEIDENLIDEFPRWKLAKKSRHGKPYSRASANHCLRVLKRALRLAYRWRHIDRLPQFSLLSGENSRDEVLPRERELEWLDACPEPLRTYSIIGVDLGLRLREFLNLAKRRCIFESDPRHLHGYVQVRRYEDVKLKSHWSHRDIPMTPRVREILKRACAEGAGDLVFPKASKNTLEDQLRRIRDRVQIPNLVLHSFRHTFGTRLGEAGAQAPQIRQLMGHQSMTTSQKYVHHLDEGISELVVRMNRSNEAAWKKAAETQIEAAAQTLRKRKSKSAAKVVTFSDTGADLTGRSTSTKPFVIN